MSCNSYFHKAPSFFYKPGKNKKNCSPETIVLNQARASSFFATNVFGWVLKHVVHSLGAHEQDHNFQIQVLIPVTVGL